MVEAYQERLTGLGMPVTYTHPLSGDRYTDIEDYFAASALALAEPMPLPDSPRTSEYAAPIIEELTSGETVPERFWYLIDWLRNAYAPAALDGPQSSGIDERQANRNLVAQVVHGAHAIALERSEPTLAAELTRLACDLLEQEMFDTGDVAAENHTINPLLVFDVQQAIARQTDQPRIFLVSAIHSGRDAQESTPAWYVAGDSERMRDMLGCALLADKLHVGESSTVRFMLDAYGLDSERLLDSWQYGFFNSSPEAPVNRIVRENLHRIVTIESERPGISRRLIESRNLQCFARLSPSFLLYLDDPHTRGTRAGIFNAVFDSSDVGEAFNEPAMYDRLLGQARAAGYDLEYYEYSTAAEWLKCDAIARDDGVVHILQQEHADPRSGQVVQIGAHGRPGSSYSVADLVNRRDAVKAHYQGIRSIAWFGCGVAKRGGLVETVAGILRDGVTVRGLKRTSGVDISFSAGGGFYMRRNRNRTPAPIIRDESGRSRLSEWAVEYFSPLIAEEVRYSDEAEATMQYGDMVMRSVI